MGVGGVGLSFASQRAEEVLGNSCFHGDKQSGRPLVFTGVVLTSHCSAQTPSTTNSGPKVKWLAYPWLALSPCAHLWSAGGQGLGVVHPCAPRAWRELGLARLPFPGGPCRFLSCLPPTLDRRDSRSQ